MCCDGDEYFSTNFHTNAELFNEQFKKKKMS